MFEFVIQGLTSPSLSLFQERLKYIFNNEKTFSSIFFLTETLRFNISDQNLCCTQMSPECFHTSDIGCCDIM